MASERIVVGVDGSHPSERALRWAIEEARVRGASLEVVHAWQFPSVGLIPYGGATMPTITFDELEKSADELVREMVYEVMGDALNPPVTTSTSMGHPAHVLLEAAEGADLLVVGCRGHGGFAGMLLGSISANVAHHAHCPVVVVR